MDNWELSMVKWRNESGKPLSSLAWLEAHHLAKLPERRAFVNEILGMNPKRIVDLGCGPGLWLELFNESAPPDCELIGVDADKDALAIASERARAWSRSCSFQLVDLNQPNAPIPDAEIFLAVNICPYLRNLSQFIEALKHHTRNGGSVIVRQYDGGLLRFGPIDPVSRQTIELSIQAALFPSEQFHHYDLDRVFEAISGSSFATKTSRFEMFQRFSPYSIEFSTYLANWVEWTVTYVGEAAANELRRWLAEHVVGHNSLPSYVAEVELIAWLS